MLYLCRLEEWNSKQTWVGKHPPEEQYLVSLPFLARNEVTEKNGDKKYKILKTEEAAKNLRHLTFVWPWEHVVGRADLLQSSRLSMAYFLRIKIVHGY